MSSRAQKVACENLLTVINRCNSGDLPGTLFLYAVMPEFFTEFATAYPALQQRCGPGTRIDLEDLQGITEAELLREIGGKITTVFRVAYDDAPVESEVLVSNMGCVVNRTLRQAMVGSGTRRLFVGTWVRALQHFRDNGVQPLSEDDADRLMEGARQQLDALSAEAVASEGE